MEKLCDRCRYDLRGSPVRGRCPECGNPFDKSTRVGIVRPTSAYDRGDRLVLGCSTLGCLGVTALLFGGAALAYVYGRGRAGGVLLFLGVLVLLPAIGLVIKWHRNHGSSFVRSMTDSSQPGDRS